jgi:hypothetical protein
MRSGSGEFRILAAVPKPFGETVPAMDFSDNPIFHQISKD